MRVIRDIYGGRMHVSDPPCSYFDKRKSYILNHRGRCFLDFYNASVRLASICPM